MVEIRIVNLLHILYLWLFSNLVNWPIKNLSIKVSYDYIV
jgi:hypothetical protein